MVSHKQNWKCIKLAHSSEICCRICVTSLEVSTSVTSVWPLIEWDMSVLDSFLHRMVLHNYINMVHIYMAVYKMWGCHSKEIRHTNQCQRRLTYKLSKDVWDANSLCPHSCTLLELLTVSHWNEMKLRHVQEESRRRYVFKWLNMKLWAPLIHSQSVYKCEYL